MSTPLQQRYILPTSNSLLCYRLMECIADHKNSKEHKYDHFPTYNLSMAVADQNTVLMTEVSQQGRLGD